MSGLITKAARQKLNYPESDEKFFVKPTSQKKLGVKKKRTYAIIPDK